MVKSSYFVAEVKEWKLSLLADGQEQFQPYMHVSEDTEMLWIFDSVKMNSTFSILLRMET